MPSPLRKIPLTPLDTLRDLLKEYAEGDAGFPGRLASQIQALKKQALPELGARFGSQGTPRGLRRAILASIAKFDWPEWVPWIARALKLPEPLVVSIGRHPFPILWSIIGAALFVALIHLVSRRRW